MIPDVLSISLFPTSFHGEIIFNSRATKGARGEFSGETLSSTLELRPYLGPRYSRLIRILTKREPSHACGKYPWMQIARWHKDLPFARATRVLYPATIYLFSRLARSCRGGYTNIELSICGSPSTVLLVRGCSGLSEKKRKINNARTADI